MSAGEISEEKRTDAASCWHFCYPTGLTCTRQLSHEGLPSILLCSLSSLHSKPGCLEARPVVMLQNPAGSREGPPSMWGAFHCAHQPSSGCQSQKEDGAVIAWKTLTEVHSTVKPSLLGDLQAKVPERIYPLHRVVLLSITCSVRNGSSDLLSTYCVPCTKFFM